MAIGKKPKKLFVAATRQDQGKTTISLGLLAAFEEMTPPVGFIKPVGQRYVEVDGVRVDEDVALMRAVFKHEVGLADMSPVTVGRSFTRDYILHPNRQSLVDRVRAAFERVAEGKSAVVIEGTGHAGVGSCFDMSNAEVAKLLGAKVIIVTEGGIGGPIDEVMLNASVFHEHGVEILGVILNKVRPEKLDSVATFVEEGLGRKGIELLGVIPHETILSNPTMNQILNEVGGDLLNGDRYLANEIETVIVGAMTAHRALDYIYHNSLLITPGDRDDLILAAMSSYAVGEDKANFVAGMLLTGGVRPHENIVRLLRRTNIPVVLVKGDSYSVAAAVNNLKIKIQPVDTKKIVMARRLVKRFVNVQRILDAL
ncbi:MAG TPA: AAA family ATPase [Planctomycetota bacterium]|nr:AAA family ATPase [Planctomycetota bacterium]HRR81927.1 AAA family ATPase [Planctomycetota bacterium]HRT94326.1 AAA family ATPase [Planctomycetota bacterium]